MIQTASQSRTWTESASNRTIEAEFVSADTATVTLKRDTDGKQFTLPLDLLSPEDLAFVDALLNPPGPPPLPKATADLYAELPHPLDRASLPITGEADPWFTPLDDSIADFMIERSIGALVAAISQNSKIVYNKAFGYQDASLTIPLPQDSVMRLASVSEPIASAALKHLFRDGSLKPGDLAFTVLKLDAVAPPNLDPRWKTITINHLLYHMAGFDREVSGDPMFEQPRIAADLGIKIANMTFADMLTWRLNTPLDFDPGQKEVYSNFGYNVLVEIIEKVSGKSYAAFLDETITPAAGLTTLIPGATRITDRASGETWYHYHPDMDREYDPFPFRMEVQAGSGSLVCSALDLVRFLEKYWISGEPRRAGQKMGFTFFGSMPGTTAVAAQHPDGINAAAIANRREKYPSEWHNQLKSIIDATLAEILK